MFAIALALGGLYLGLSGFVALVEERFDPALIPGILLIGLSAVMRECKGAGPADQFGNTLPTGMEAEKLHVRSRVAYLAQHLGG